MNPTPLPCVISLKETSQLMKRLSILLAPALVLGGAVLLVAEPRPEGPDPLVWTEVPTSDGTYPRNQQVDRVRRAKVPGGWLVHVSTRGGKQTGLTYYPDPAHGWGKEKPARTHPVRRPQSPPRQARTRIEYLAPKGLPKDQQVPGIPWLRRVPNVAYAKPRLISFSVYQRCQAFKAAWRLANTCGGEVVGEGFQINWLQKDSYLAMDLDLRVGDVLLSINHVSIRRDPEAVHRELRSSRRFALLIRRKGKLVVLPFEVAEWLEPRDR